MAYARSLVLMLMLMRMSMVMSHTSLHLFVSSFVLALPYAYVASENQALIFMNIRCYEALFRALRLLG